MDILNDSFLIPIRFLTIGKKEGKKKEKENKCTLLFFVMIMEQLPMFVLVMDEVI